MHAAEQVGSSLPAAIQVCRMIAQVYVCACYSAVSFASLVECSDPRLDPRTALGEGSTPLGHASLLRTEVDFLGTCTHFVHFA